MTGRQRQSYCLFRCESASNAFHKRPVVRNAPGITRPLGHRLCFTKRGDVIQVECGNLRRRRYRLLMIPAFIDSSADRTLPDNRPWILRPFNRGLRFAERSNDNHRIFVASLLRNCCPAAVAWFVVALAMWESVDG